MLRKIARRVLFGKRKNYKRNFNNKHVTWYTYNTEINRLNSTIDNLLKKLKLKRIENGNLIGDEKDAKAFDNQWS